MKFRCSVTDERPGAAQGLWSRIWGLAMGRRPALQAQVLPRYIKGIHEGVLFVEPGLSHNSQLRSSEQTQLAGVTLLTKAAH